MKGFHTGNEHNNFIEKVKQNTAELCLLAKEKSTEIMIQNINADKLIAITPGNTSNTMEFFYILEGKLKYKYCPDGEEQILTKGDFFYVKDIDCSLHFTTMKDTKLLYISNQPVFQYLSKRIKELYKIVQQVEEKDVYTHNHGKRVEEYSIKVAEKLGFTADRLNNFGFAALFHDIGKINVPDKVLNKPSSLTDEEWLMIKNHPSDGQKMVEGTMLQEIGQIIAQHHERLDGSGYPVGISGEDLLLEARIIGVIDTYDAMTTDRPYRKGMEPIEAVKELKRLTGLHYDKTVVDAFVEILIGEKKIFENNKVI